MKRYGLEMTYTGYDFGFAFFPPLSNLSIDLVTKLGFNLSCISCEES